MKEDNSILNIFGQVDEKYIEEAAPGKRAKKKLAWVKWTSVAACFILVVALGVGILQGKWFKVYDIATLDDGTIISFMKCDAAMGTLSLDYDATTRELNAEETDVLFGTLPVTAHAIFSTDNNQLIGFDGKIGDIKIRIATSDLPIFDVVIEGEEKTININGVSVNAGYFLTDANSRGEQTAIYFASFELGSSIVYVENAGAKADSERVKNDLAIVIQKLIINGELDTAKF